MGRLTFTVAGALDDDLVAGVGQPVQGAVAQNGVVKEAQPFVHGTIAGDDEAGRPVPVEDEFVKVGGLLRSEPVQAQIVQNEQVWGQEGPEGPVHRVVHSGLGHGLEEVVGVAEADGVPRPDGGVSQGLGRKLLPTPAGPTSKTCSCLSRKSREKAASSERRSKMIEADQSKSSNRQVSWKPALCSRISMRR